VVGLFVGDISCIHEEQMLQVNRKQFLQVKLVLSSNLIFLIIKFWNSRFARLIVNFAHPYINDVGPYTSPDKSLIIVGME